MFHSFDKTDIVKLAKSLAEHGIEIVSTGGTAILVDNNIEVTQIDEITNPEVWVVELKHYIQIYTQACSQD